MNEQEKFWAGEFGDAYVDRNSFEYMPSKIHFMANVVDKCSKINSVLELGANTGLNIRALKMLLPNLRTTAVEINEKACNILRADKIVDHVLNISIQDFWCDSKFYDFVLCSGVLTHQNPESLPKIYDIIAHAAKKYVCIAEYYNPTPVTVPYRGHNDRIFKRDFAGEFLDSHPEYELISYAFIYHRDPNFPLDDATWFLMRRKN